MARPRLMPTPLTPWNWPVGYDIISGLQRSVAAYAYALTALESVCLRDSTLNKPGCRIRCVRDRLFEITEGARGFSMALRLSIGQMLV